MPYTAILKTTLLCTVLLPLHLYADHPTAIPEEARAMETAFQNQKDRIATASFRKYGREMTQLLDECVKKEDFEMAKTIRDTIRARTIPETECSSTDFFKGAWIEPGQNGNPGYTHHFDGTVHRVRPSHSAGIIDESSKNDEASQPGILVYKKGRKVTLVWIRMDDNKILQVQLENGYVSSITREKKLKGPGEGSSVLQKYHRLLNKISSDMEAGQTKLNAAYTELLEKKSRAWAQANKLDEAIWARQRMGTLSEQELSGTWDFPKATVQFSSPSRFGKTEKHGGKKTSFSFVRSLNDHVHVFKIQESGKEKIVVRSGGKLLIIPPSVNGLAEIGTLKR